MGSFECATTPVPPAIREGAFHAYFIFDVADTIDLNRLEQVAGAGVARAPLQLRREASAASISFPQPPVVLAIPAPGSAKIRVKAFDYGVVSIRLSEPFAGPWDDFTALTRRLRGDPDLEQSARETLARVLVEIGPALDDPHEPLLEDYYVFEVESFESVVTATHLLGPCAPALAGLMLGEERPLTASEQEETLRVRFAYFEDDLAVVQWDTAFVYDRRENANAVFDILEFANTQLVELRRYDLRLDQELDDIYKLDPKRPARRFGRRQAQEAADRVRYLIVDVVELTDRATNALKIIGDAYYARLFRGVAGRLGLKDWQQQIDAKLDSVNGMYRFFTDQVQAARGEFTEVVVIVLIALEIVIGLLALRH